MKFLSPCLVVVGFALLLARPAVGAEEARFTTTLSPTESTDAGLGSLNSDQLAVLDALVRRDIAAADFVTKQPRAAQFSDRLSADERHNSGLASLSPEQLARVDTFVARLMPLPKGATSLLARTPPSYLTTSVKVNRAPEIHGMISLMYGTGSHGYSEYGGAILLTYDDPANNFGLAVGYSETHSKGGYFLRRGYDRFDSYGFDPYSWNGSPRW